MFLFFSALFQSFTHSLTWDYQFCLTYKAVWERVFFYKTAFSGMDVYWENDDFAVHTYCITNWCNSMKYKKHFQDSPGGPAVSATFSPGHDPCHQKSSQVISERKQIPFNKIEKLLVSRWSHRLSHSHLRSQKIFMVQLRWGLGLLAFLKFSSWVPELLQWMLISYNIPTCV